MGPPDDVDVDVDVDAIDRRSAHLVARSALLVRVVDKVLQERRDHLTEIDDSLRRVRALTEAVDADLPATS